MKIWCFYPSDRYNRVPEFENIPRNELIHVALSVSNAS